MSIMRDEEFQKRLLAFICRDRNFLKDLGHLIEADDFKPGKGQGYENQTIATSALEFWQKYREPIGPMLRVEMKDFAEKMKLGEKQKTRLLETVKEVNESQKLVAVDAVVEKIIEYKKSRLKKKSVDQLIELQEEGALTDEKWFRICMQAVDTFGKLQYKTSDYLEEADKRIQRREELRRSILRYPLLMIDPLDEEVNAITRGQIGLILALYKMGKSYALEHIALAYAVQGINVLDFTLEDPIDVREDRYDAALTGLMINRLADLPKKFKKRFQRQKGMIHSRIKIVDGTEGGMTVQRIEEIWEKERNRGFDAGAVIVDYDDEIVPVKKRDGEHARRFEFADIYRDYRQFIARRRLFGWTAAQTGRGAEGKRVISAGYTAEDISKIRKVSFAIGIGDGEWGNDSRYLNIAVSKTDKMKVGWNIMTDFKRGVFYDREATLRAMAKDKKKKKRED